MPAGLTAGLKPSDFADLIAYLEGLRSNGQGTPGSGVPRADHSASWLSQ